VFPRGRTLALAGAGIVLTAMVVWLGLVTPFTDPARTRVDNALLLLGGLGLANTLLLARARMIAPGTGVRVALAGYAALSAAALALTDFGAHRTVGWTIKTVGVGVLLFTLRELIRGH
jgi:hypothetical protein